MIIANSCAGSFCYQEEHGIKKSYDNPFVGCTIFGEEYYKLLKYFEDINFNNIKVYTGIFPKNNEERNYLIIDNLVKVWYVHYDTLEIVEDRWNSRVGRMIDFINQNNNWKDKILFVSSPYRPQDSLDILTKIALHFPQYHQLIDTNSLDHLYIRLPLSRNTTLFNQKYEHYYTISEYIRDNMPQYI